MKALMEIRGKRSEHQQEKLFRLKHCIFSPRFLYCHDKRRFVNETMEIEWKRRLKALCCKKILKLRFIYI
jgi:hypothetical protein